MNRELLVGRILEDEALRGDLSDDAGQLLLDWLVHQAEAAIDKSKTASEARKRIDALCQRGRTIAQFVTQAKGDPTAAAALAKAERLPWPVSPEEIADEVRLTRKVLAAESVDAPH
jgi:hypothetical protein